jgi:hypothetical protein
MTAMIFKSHFHVSATLRILEVAVVTLELECIQLMDFADDGMEIQIHDVFFVVLCDRKLHELVQPHPKN